MRILPEFLNKKFSTTIGIIVILLFALLIGGFLIWQYWSVAEKISFFDFVVIPDDVIIVTDKTEYEQGESVKVTIINNTEQEVWVLGSVEPFYFAVEGFNGNDWVEIKRLWCPCGAACEAVIDLNLEPGKKYGTEWDQQESWCTDKPPREQGMVSQQVPAGKYRVKSRITSDLELGFPGTIYSNEFRIKEKESISILNPSAVYCKELGYQYKIRTEKDGGQYGVCIFPDETECRGWSFYRGSCGQRFTFCEKQGYKIENRTDDMGTWMAEYAVCVFDDGSECSEEDYFKGGCHPSECKKWKMSEEGCIKD